MTALTNTDIDDAEILDAVDSTNHAPAEKRAILDPGLDLTLRPMRYPRVLRALQGRDSQHLERRRGRLD